MSICTYDIRVVELPNLLRTQNECNLVFSKNWKQSCLLRRWKQSWLFHKMKAIVAWYKSLNEKEERKKTWKATQGYKKCFLTSVDLYEILRCDSNQLAINSCRRSTRILVTGVAGYSKSVVLTQIYSSFKSNLVKYIAIELLMMISPSLEYGYAKGLSFHCFVYFMTIWDVVSSFVFTVHLCVELKACNLCCCRTRCAPWAFSSRILSGETVTQKSYSHWKLGGVR